MLKLAVLACLVMFSAPPVFAQAGRGVRPEVDDSGNVIATLIAKDIGGQRWSMRLGLEGDTAGRITGIVTDPNNPNTDPEFAQCDTIDFTGTPGDVDNENIIFNCQVGPKCPSRAAGSCQAWQDVGQVAVPASFFLPPQ